MTTERVLPAIALPIQARPRPTGAAVRVAAPAHAATRREALLTTPARAGMLIGASAAVYAVTLAGVAGLQSGADAELAATRRPYIDAVTETRVANDRLEAALLEVGTEAKALGELYAQAGADLTAYEARLDSLSALVAEVKGSAASLPSRIGLPKVTVRGPVRSTRAPATTSKSGASGG